MATRERFIHIQAPSPTPAIFGMGMWSITETLCGQQVPGGYRVLLQDLFESGNPTQTAELEARDNRDTHSKCPGCWAKLPSLVAHIPRYRAWRMYNLVRCLKCSWAGFYGLVAWIGGPEGVCPKCASDVTKPTTPERQPESKSGLARLFS